MEEALTAHLLASSGLTALVGDRIDWARRPQGKRLPAVVLFVVDALPAYTMQGPTSLVSSRIQVDCWGETYASVKAVAREVTQALSGIDEVINGVDLRGGFKEAERDSFEVGGGGADLYRVSLDFTIWTGSAA